MAGADPFVHRTLADCRPQLIFYYSGHMNRYASASEVEGTFRAGVYGQTREFRKFTTDSEFGIFGIDLYPYTFPCLFSLPANALTNQIIDLGILLGKEGQLLEEKVMSASSNVERVRTVSRFLAAKLRNTRRFHPNVLHSLRRILNAPSPISMNELSREFYVSRRQFERKFKELCGFSPKACLKILRFNSAIRRHGGATSLTQLAYECGYYDQSHFVHDFHAFSGYTPREFFEHITNGENYKTSADFKP